MNFRQQNDFNAFICRVYGDTEIREWPRHVYPSSCKARACQMSGPDGHDKADVAAAETKFNQKSCVKPLDELKEMIHPKLNSFLTSSKPV